MIKQCNCSNEYQDKTYGKNMRVMNSCKNGDAARCTVCSKEVSGGEKKK